MGINYFRYLNKERIEIRAINFWQALGLSFLFDIVVMFLNTPTDAFYMVLNNFGINTYSDFLVYYINFIILYLSIWNYFNNYRVYK